MFRTIMVVSAVVACLAARATAAEHQPDPKMPAIQELANLLPKREVFKGGRPPQPTVLKSEKEASECFSEAELAKLKEKVDFTRQIVLLFAWRGSGQDKLSYSVSESNPEQITFTYRGGMTRDLRPHIHIYSLRSNVKWSVK